MKQFYPVSLQKAYPVFCEFIRAFTANIFNGRKLNFNPGRSMKICAVALFSLMGLAGKAQNKVTGITVSSQSAPVIYGTSTSVTYTVDLTLSGDVAAGSTGLSLSWTGAAPAGVIYSFTPDPVPLPGNNTSTNATLTITYDGGEDAGSYGFTVSSDNDPHTSNTASFIVNQRALNVSATGINKVYDGLPNATVNLSEDRVSGDDITVSYTTAIFADANVGTGKPVSVSGISASGPDAGNYTLASTTASASADITAVTLIITATGINKIYDGLANATVNLSDDRVSGDNITVSYTTATFADANVGTGKPVSVSGISISGPDAGNYTLASATASASADITVATLTVTAAGINKVYDGNATATVTLSDDRVSGDNITISYTTATFADANVGTGKPVSVSGISISGPDAGNYTLASTTASASADITVATLTVTATGINKVYDGLTNATVNLSDDRVSGDNITVSYTTATFADANVGTGKPVSVSGISISGPDAGNYTLASTTASATANITTATLTVTATGINKVYDGLTNATVNLSDDRVSGDNITVSYTTATFADANVGTGKPVSVSGISISGPDAGNYTLASATASASADITVATLTVTATGINKVYDGLTNATVNLSDDRVSGDNITVSYTTATFADANVGTGKPVSVSGISVSGPDAGNYTLASTTASATANITTATLTVTATGINKAYDGNTTATVTLSDDRVSGDNITVSYTTAAFANANVGTGKPVSVSGISISGPDAGNYTLASATASASADITPVALSITANNGSKAYGTVYPTGAGSTAFTSSGLLAGETIGSITITSTGAPANATVAGSPYPIVASAATGGTFNPANYTITYNNGSLTVTQATLTITANNGSKAYGTVYPTGAGSTAFTSSGLLAGETIGSITITSTGAPANATVAGSPYPIVASAATGGTFNPANYTIGYVNGSLTVTGATLTITANSGSKTYGTVYPTGAGSTAFTATGLLAGETVGSITIASTGAPANATVAGSPYPIVPSAATGGTFNPANYTIVYTNGSLAVNKAALSITADDRTKVYGSTLALGTTAFTSSGLQNGETIGGVTLTSTGAVNTANVGSYPVIPSAATGGTFNANNYTITYNNGTLNVTQAPLTITANNQNKVYGTTANLGTTAFTATGLQNGQTIGGVTLTSTGSINTAPVGPYPIIPSNATGGTFNPANYTITYNTTGILTVTQAIPSITVNSNNNPSCLGSTVTFTATIISSPNVTGQVQFFDGATSLGIINVASNSAAISTSALTAGTHSITARYLGDANFGSVTSAAINQVVNAPPPTTGYAICQGATVPAGGGLTSIAACAASTPGMQGPRFAGNGSGWTNSIRITANDGSPATVSVTSVIGSAASATLTANQFGFAIPVNATINSIVVTISRAANGSNVRDNSVRLLKAGVATGDNDASATSWPTALATVSYNGLTNALWNTTWTPADINNANFGIAFSGLVTSSLTTRTLSVDYIQITVTYTIPGSLNWYTASGTLIGNGSPFNPVGVAGSGLPNTNTPGTYTFYAECTSVQPGCRTATDFVINPLPAVASISGAASVCSGVPSTYTNATSGGTWSVTNGSGTATITSGGVLTGVNAGTVTVNYTYNNGTCSNTATLSVTVSGVPTTANAGPDQTGASTCGQTQVTLAGNQPTVGTGLWTIVSGTGGTINNPNVRNSTFTGVAGNTYVLRWTISNSPCNPSSDEVTITFNRNPTAANAGPDQASCGLTSVTLAANTPTVGTGSWSIVSGTGGSFVNASDPNTTFNGNPGVTYTLRWTISNPPCTASTNDVIISLNYNLIGLYSVGTGNVAGENGHFTTLTAAVNNYNTCLGGNVTFVLTDATYSTNETFPIVIDNPTASSTRTLTIKPNTGVNATITGTSATATIQLNGADYITIDGSNNGSTTRNLTIRNTNTTFLQDVPVWIASKGTNGATNNTIKNCIITGSGTSTAWAGIATGSNTSYPDQADAQNNNNTINNCLLSNAVNGIYIYGASTKDQNWTIENNVVTSGYSAGILIQNANVFNITSNAVSGINANAVINANTSGIEVTSNGSNFTIANNTISGVINSGAPLTSGGTSGILLGATSQTGTVSDNIISNVSNTGGLLAGNTDGIKITGPSQSISITGNTISNISASGNGQPAMGIEFSGAAASANTIAYNKISAISQSANLLGLAGYGAEGIYLNTSGSPTISVYNNFIANVTSYGSNATPTYNNNGYGIAIDAGSGYKIYHNSVNLRTNQNLNNSYSAAIYISSAVTAVGAIDLTDNIFVNNQTSGAPAARRYSIYSGRNNNNIFNGNIDYNDYWTTVATGRVLGFIGSNRANLAAIQAGFGANTNSVDIQPIFTSATDLHLDPANNITLDNLGTPIGGITDDIDADIRSTVTPDIGADEFNACTAGLYTWIGVVNDDWNVPGNWCSNAVPTITVAAVIPAGMPNDPHIYNATANAASVDLNAGATLTMSNAQVLNIASAYINDGSFVAGDGTVNFTTAATFSGNAATFNNVGMSGNLTLSAVPTINGNFTINSGQVLTNSPIYGNSSTLIYNATGAYTTGNEWDDGAAGTTASGSGIPQNVTIQSGTITIPNALGANRALAGNLTINAGQTLQNAAGSTRDLYILGDWINNGGAFNANGRTVDFNLTSATLGTQTITGTTTFYNLTFGNANVVTNFGSSNTTVTNQFNNDAGTMAGGTSVVTLNGGAGTIIGSAAKNFYDLQIPNSSVITHSTGGGNIHISNSFINNGSLTENAAYTFYFDNSGATETFTGSGATTFGNLVIGTTSGIGSSTTLNCSADFTVTGGSMSFFHNSAYNGSNNIATFSSAAATVSGSGTANFYDAVTNVALNLGSGISTINNSLQINTGGSIITNSPNYGVAATLIYNTTTANLPTGLEWIAYPGAVGIGQPLNITVKNANNVALAGNRTVPGTLNIDAANTLVINDHILTVNTAISGAGSLTGSQLSGLILGGSAPALKFTTGGFNNYLKTFTINSGGSAALANELNISGGNSGTGYGVLTANGNLNAAANLTLQSTNDGTAQVGPSYGNITGDVTVQRYFPAIRAWRFVGVPFSSTSQTIKDAWQEGFTDVALTCPPQNQGTPGYGTAISFNNTSGYDVHNNNYKTSIQVHKNNMWVTPPSTTTNLVTTPASPAPAYSLFVRGDRSVCLTYTAPPNVTTLRPRGVLNQVNSGAPLMMNFGSDVPNGYIMIGNPYAATVNIQNVLATASGIVNNRFLVWDPKLGYPVGTGGYVTFSSGVWDEPTSPLAAAGTSIQSGQAFFVQRNSSGSSAAVTFAETDKNTGFQDIDVFGLQAASQSKVPTVVYTSLFDTSGNLMGGVAAAFGKGYSAAVDSIDAPKRWNEEIENIAIVRNEQTLAIEFRPTPGKTDTIFYRLYLRQKPYKLRLYANDLPANLPGQAWLVDKYLGTQTEVNLYDTAFYTFTPNTDTNSYRNRFMLVFNRTKPDRPAIIDSLISKIKARIYPNPVSGKKFNLVLENAIAGDYTINIYTMAGKLAATRKISFQPGNNTHSIPVPATIAAGNYIVQILNGNKVVVASMPLIISK